MRAKGPGVSAERKSARAFFCFLFLWKKRGNMDEKTEICQGMGPKREKIFHFSHWGEDFTENAGKGKNRKNEKKRSVKSNKK